MLLYWRTRFTVISRLYRQKNQNRNKSGFSFFKNRAFLQSWSRFFAASVDLTQASSPSLPPSRTLVALQLEVRAYYWADAQDGWRRFPVLAAKRGNAKERARNNDAFVRNCTRRAFLMQTYIWFSFFEPDMQKNKKGVLHETFNRKPNMYSSIRLSWIRMGTKGERWRRSRKSSFRSFFRSMRFAAAMGGRGKEQDGFFNGEELGGVTGGT